MKIFYTSILFLFISILTQAQDTKVRYGIKGGANLSTITGREIFDKNNPRISFHAGGVIEIPLSEVFSLQPELLYSQQGSRFVQTIELRDGANEEPVLLDINYDFNLNYITVPLLAKYYVSERFNFNLGPQIAYLLTAKEKNNFPTQTQGESETQNDIKDGYKDLDFSVKIGAEYYFKSDIFLGVSYGLSLTKINKFENTIEDNAQRNSVFQLSIGYKF
ncbi:porin family protein [Aquimarina sp. SS2-1]|uniref:porin family protein n=1 Tax=Aquimarina besae TaxID=3342247 RepID=UPI00366F0C96